MDIVTYLIRATILVTIGVVVANIALESNIMSRLSSLTKPLCSASNLPQECMFSLFTCFLSPTSGKSALAEFYREGKIGNTKTMLTVVMSTFPIVVGESLFRVHAPVALVLLGYKIGGIYILLNFFSSFLQSFAAFVCSKSFLPCQDGEVSCDEKEVASNGQFIKTALKKSFTTVKNVVPIMILTFLAIYLLMLFGGMNYISSSLEPILRLLNLPGECITALIAQFLHFSAGYATVAMLLTEGMITAKQAIITLLVGSIIVISMIHIKYSLPMYVSLFGKFGVKITAIKYLSSLLSKTMMILLVMVIM